MGWFNVLGSVVSGAVNLFASERSRKTDASIRRSDAEVSRNNIKIEADLKKDSILFESQQRMKEESHFTDMTIKRETEIVRILNEIDELRKDTDFERMKATSDAMMVYHEKLTKINVEAITAIGLMRIDLQRKAYDLIQEKTEQYAALQNKALIQAEEDFNRIDTNPNLSEASKNILIKGVDKKLETVINNASRFIDQINDDMQLISKDINLITMGGQKFIEHHLEGFKLINHSQENKADSYLINNDSMKQIK